MSLKYLVNISYEPSHVNGQELVSIGGVTQSVSTYSSSFYIASMPEVKIWATGSSYEEALDNLLIASTSSNVDTSTPALSTTKTW
jgi:hypothetical protein